MGGGGKRRGGGNPHEKKRGEENLTNDTPPKNQGEFKGINKWDKRSQLSSFSQIFADFCRFSLFLGITAFGRRSFSQRTAGNRFSQKTTRNRRISKKPVCPM